MCILIVSWHWAFLLKPGAEDDDDADVATKRAADLDRCAVFMGYSFGFAAVDIVKNCKAFNDSRMKILDQYRARVCQELGTMVKVAAGSLLKNLGVLFKPLEKSRFGPSSTYVVDEVKARAVHTYVQDCLKDSICADLCLQVDGGGSIPFAVFGFLNLISAANSSIVELTSLREKGFLRDDLDKYVQSAKGASEACKQLDAQLEENFDKSSTAYAVMKDIGCILSGLHADLKSWLVAAITSDFASTQRQFSKDVQEEDFLTMFKSKLEKGTDDASLAILFKTSREPVAKKAKSLWKDFVSEHCTLKVAIANLENQPQSDVKVTLADEKATQLAQAPPNQDVFKQA